MTRRLDVESNTGRYPVFVGENILEYRLREVLSDFRTDQVFVLVDEQVNKFHKDRIQNAIGDTFARAHYKPVPRGEASKSLHFWTDTIHFLLNNGARRNTPVLVIGGGVTGDVGGFAAAAALRGMPLIHVPTTVLAMVDSSIGGKTGINHNTGKNLIGAFYQPKAVIADTSFLQTLPRREWTNGLSEILKYGAIRDTTIFQEAGFFLNEDPASFPRQALADLIAKCIRIKAEIVQEDEFEGGIRAFLNFGHTFAHALEKACDFDTISHGEAVFLGMLAARTLSNLTVGELPENPFEPFKPLYQYRVTRNGLSHNQLTQYMESDKKRTGKHITFVLLEAWQHPVLKTVKDQQLIEQAWEVVFSELPEHP